MSNQSRREISLGFTPQIVTEGQHICYLFNDEAERIHVMSRYFESGMLAGEKLLYLADRTTPEEMISLVEDLGIGVSGRSGAFTALPAAEKYCPTGVFNAEEMLLACRDFYNLAKQEGYAGARSTGEMSWCLKEGVVQMDDLIDYEAALNPLLEVYPLTVCCQYDTRRFDGKTIMDVLAVHPVSILRGQLFQNPFYIPPSEFRQAMRAQRAATT